MFLCKKAYKSLLFGLLGTAKNISKTIILKITKDWKII